MNKKEKASSSTVHVTNVEEEIHQQSTTQNISTVPVHLDKLIKGILFAYGKRTNEDCDSIENEDENMDIKGSADNNIPVTVLQLEAELKRKAKKLMKEKK